MSDSIKHGAMYDHDPKNIVAYRDKFLKEDKYKPGKYKNYSREYQAMTLRRIEGMTYGAIATSLGVKRERARQLSAKGEAVLNRLLAIDGKGKVALR